jgi:hypothetical protein
MLGGASFSSLDGLRLWNPMALFLRNGQFALIDLRF